MKERVITAIVLLLVVIGALFFDPTGWAVKILIVLVAAACDWELARIGHKRTPVPVATALIIAVILSKEPVNQGPAYLLAAILAAPMLVWGIRKKDKLLTGVMGFFWLCATILPLYVLASTKSPSYWPLLMTAAIPIWCGDTAAIFVGKAFGKHKMAPEISPKKTWEGAAGNFLACVAAALILGAIFHYPMLPMVLLGINCGVLGQAGDLFESWMKRKTDTKDSGNILPGHGGVLDRIDSLMATAPLSLLILQSMVVAVKP